MSDDFNMSVRKFLKQVGVTGQAQIEKAVREGAAPGATYPVRAVIEIPELGLTHVVEGEISAPAGEPE